MSDLTTTHLYREIHEQPAVLTRLLLAERAAAADLAVEIRRRQVDHVVVAARGSSDNAARYAQYLLAAANGLPVGLATPSLFTVYAAPPRFGNALVLGISQSGQSPDIVAVLAEARRQGALTAAITNAPGSPLAQMADFVLHLHAGEERAIAATKTYTASLAAIALLSVALDEDPKRRAALEELPGVVAQALALAGVDRVAERYRYMSACVVIGRGFNYCTAFELALKLKELTYTVAEPYSSADFRHGPLALVSEGFPMVIVAPSGKMLPEMLDFMATARSRGAELLVISDHPEALALARVPLALPTGAPEWLSPLLTVLPGQLFAMHLAHARDLDVDHPRGLRKVTETR
ncbi:MAG: SIS domain-containing protein [Caldilineales bacterium]|nr:SIS domain-containing protein [Caldilineales bacterium]MDW8316324.1 SIS domain-containing protein [Anaerolineae bacterium]